MEKATPLETPAPEPAVIAQNLSQRVLGQEGEEEAGEEHGVRESSPICPPKPSLP